MTNKKFFEKFGINPQWVVGKENQDSNAGDIFINENDSNKFPNINDGDEVSVDVGDTRIDGDTFRVKGTDNDKNREFFKARMVKGDDAGNNARFVKIINEMADHEGGPFMSVSEWIERDKE